MLARRLSAERGSERYAARRRLTRRRALIALLIFLLITGTASLIGLRQQAVRIWHVQVFGDSAARAVLAIVEKNLAGSYVWIVPRNSIFFFPASRIREEILSSHPEIAAVSIFRNGFRSVSVKVSPRVPVARWCGTNVPTADAANPCFAFDSSGYIFSAVTDLASTTPDIVTPFALYGPLADNAAGPLRATIAHAEKLPGIFNFARKVSAFDTPVEKIILRGDEVDDILSNGTRITYVLGSELAAYTALSSAKADLNLSSGALEYVDLRFDGKVYLKKR